MSLSGMRQRQLSPSRTNHSLSARHCSHWRSRRRCDACAPSACTISPNGWATSGVVNRRWRCSVAAIPCSARASSQRQVASSSSSCVCSGNGSAREARSCSSYNGAEDGGSSVITISRVNAPFSLNSALACWMPGYSCAACSISRRS